MDTTPAPIQSNGAGPMKEPEKVEGLHHPPRPQPVPLSAPPQQADHTQMPTQAFNSIGAPHGPPSHIPPVNFSWKKNPKRSLKYFVTFTGKSSRTFCACTYECCSSPTPCSSAACSKCPTQSSCDCYDASCSGASSALSAAVSTTR